MAAMYVLYCTSHREVGRYTNVKQAVLYVLCKEPGARLKEELSERVLKEFPVQPFCSPVTVSQAPK